jgi:hypothetical protein
MCATNANLCAEGRCLVASRPPPESRSTPESCVSLSPVITESCPCLLALATPSLNANDNAPFDAIIQRQVPALCPFPCSPSFSWPSVHAMKSGINIPKLSKKLPPSAAVSPLSSLASGSPLTPLLASPPPSRLPISTPYSAPLLLHPASPLLPVLSSLLLPTNP